MMTAPCQVPLSFTPSLGFFLRILLKIIYVLKIVRALNINKAHYHDEILVNDQHL